MGTATDTSDICAQIPRQATCPDQLSKPVLVSQQQGQITVTCGQPQPYSDGGAPIERYRFTYYDANQLSGFRKTVTVEQNDPFFRTRQATLTELVDGVQYTVYCEAINDVCPSV